MKLDNSGGMKHIEDESLVFFIFISPGRKRVNSLKARGRSFFGSEGGIETSKSQDSILPTNFTAGSPSFNPSTDGDRIRLLC